MKLPSWRDWLFSGKAFLASMLALYIALAFDLPRPYWAMAAVYVVSNPLVGATSSKALYRALGTLIGACASVILVPLFVDSPELFSLVVALWTGTLLYMSMLDRTPRSYVFMLAGYSLALIALPSVGAPETIFDTAVARSEEIILGITCAAVVGAVVFPASVATVLSERIGTWLGDAADWAEDILRGDGAVPATPLKRQQLAADISGLDLIISQLSYDPGTRDFASHARQLRSRLLMLLPLFSSLADRLHEVKARNPDMLERLRPQLHAIADWLKHGNGPASTEDADRFRTALSALEPTGDQFSWDNLIFASALARLKEIVSLWQDCLTLRDQIVHGRAAADWRPALRHRRLIGRARLYDHGLLLFSTGCVVVATLVTAMFWIYSGWANGATFVMMTAVAGSFFAAMDRPAPFIVRMFVWCAVSLVASAVYLFAILPMVHEYEMLVLVFVVPFLVIGALIPRPQANLLAMLLTVNTASFMALQNRYGADFTTFANEAIAALGGIGFALAATLITRPFGAELAAARLLRAGWADLAETAAGRRRQDQEKLSARMLDRLGQIVPRLAAIDKRDIGAVDGFAEVRVGYNVLELQRQRRRLDEPAAEAINAVLIGVAAFYRQRSAEGRAADAPDALRLRLDHALRMTAYESHRRARRACDALVGLRRALFPHAPAPYDDSAADRPFALAAE